MTARSAAGGELAVEDGLRKWCVRHANQVARPAKLSLREQGFDSGHLAAL